MTTRSHHDPLRACLRAAEADARRIHGAAAPHPRPGLRRRRGPLLAVGFSLLAFAAASLLSTGAAREDTAPARIVAHVPAHDNGIHRLPFDAAPAMDRDARVRPPAPKDTAPPEVIDGGDVDIATQMPASVLTADDGQDAPRPGLMNVPTVPDARDAAPGDVEAVD